ncbi:hypothetical protein Gotur_030445 [Gossypium turneri]
MDQTEKQKQSLSQFHRKLTRAMNMLLKLSQLVWIPKHHC